MARILITGARAPIALDLTRQMARAGHSVWVADSILYPISAFSRYVQSYIRVPEPRSNPKAFVDTLSQAMGKNAIDLLIPTCEEIFYIARHRRRFACPDTIFCSDFELLDHLHNKYTFATSVASSHVKAPETYLLKTSNDVANFAETSTELVFKPVYSRFASRTLIKPSAERLNLLKPEPTDLWVAQRHITGKELCSYSVARGGVLTAHICYDPLYRLGQSSSFYFCPQDNIRILDFVRDYVARKNFTGQISFDYIAQPDGECFVLECNPRAISGLHLFANCSDFPRAFLDQPADRLITPDPRQSYMITIAMMTAGIPSAFRSGRAKNFLRDFKQAKDVIWSGDDIKPSFGQLSMLGEFMCRSLKWNCSFRDASCRDIEWNGQEIG
jgi:hypothetical protein